MTVFRSVGAPAGGCGGGYGRCPTCRRTARTRPRTGTHPRQVRRRHGQPRPNSPEVTVPTNDRQESPDTARMAPRRFLESRTSTAPGTRLTSTQAPVSPLRELLRHTPSDFNTFHDLR